MSISSSWPWILTLIDITLAAWVTVDAILRKRDSRSAIAWTGLAWLAPFLGSLAYFCLGINRIQRKGVKLGVQHTLKSAPEFRFSQNEIQKAKKALKEHPNFAGLAAVGSYLTGTTLIPGNHIQCLMDGDQTYPAMIKAINKAKHSVSLLSYIFDSDRAGEQILKALKEANKRGVKVRVLIDHVGASYSKIRMVSRLKQHGIKAESFLPTKFGRLPNFANLRNHRKILVVDGKIGFTGGTNIREAHWISLKPKQPTQCLHFKLEGPVVSQLQRVFVTDWAFATGENLSGTSWLPDPKRSGDIWARGIAHGPDEDFESLSKVIFAALATARERVRILTPYFLPDSRLIEALSVAALRGVHVEIYLPSENNIPIVEWAATAQLPLMLENGCKVFKSPPTLRSHQTDDCRRYLEPDRFNKLGPAKSSLKL